MEEREGGWNARGFHRHRKWCLHVGRVASSSRALLSGKNTFAALSGCRDKHFKHQVSNESVSLNNKTRNVLNFQVLSEQEAIAPGTRSRGLLDDEAPARKD